MIGTRNERQTSPVESDISPISNGAAEPPAIVMTRREDACLVFPPLDLNAKEKIVGYMRLSDSSTTSNPATPTLPGKAITIAVAHTASMEQSTSSLVALRYFIIQLPSTRPATKSPMPP